MINLGAISNAKVFEFPFKWGIADGLLSADQQGVQMCDEFPIDSFRYRRYLSGRYLRRPLVELDAQDAYRGEELSDAYRELASDLTSSAYRNAVSNATGIDLEGSPMDAALWRSDAATELRMHLDSEPKLLTHVIYLNHGWTAEDGGKLQILASENESDVAFEVLPRFGLSVFIARSPVSWHNITPISSTAPDSRNTLTINFYHPGTTSKDLPVR
ncbi:MULTISPECIES: 2OG-Fe(II) oxygenase [Burkholderia]|uniref:2OG-Fe(II) oxygenase n=1 Tax=Burkholderia TaxID=32008 RepID=UPI00157A8440|nr:MULTISPECIES: 2OG-Fe(II) oxygenase [Burkholderia]MCU9952090.1 2OG-Fe(II) oxygenase [Burkholderia sp. BKH01]